MSGRLRRAGDAVGWRTGFAPWSVLALTVLNGAAFGTFWAFAGIFALRALGASTSAIAVMFVVSAAGSMLTGYLGPRISDRVGRRWMIALGCACQTLAVIGLIAAGGRSDLGVPLVVAAALAAAPVRPAVAAAMADLVPGDRLEVAYAQYRVAQNVGIGLGPPLGAVLLLLAGWQGFLAGIALIGAASCVVTVRFVRVPPAGDAGPRVSLASLTAGGSGLGLLIATAWFGFALSVAFEAVLPIVATSSYRLPAPAWGCLAAINPLLVALLQLRTTAVSAAVSGAGRLAIAALLMGFSFLPLLVSAGIAAIALVSVVFTLGEMLWFPTIQALVSELAPPRHRGAWLGAFSSSGVLAGATVPPAALWLRSARGDAAVWVALAGVSAIGALVSCLTTGLSSRPRAERRPERSLGRR